MGIGVGRVQGPGRDRERETSMYATADKAPAASPPAATAATR